MSLDAPVELSLSPPSTVASLTLAVDGMVSPFTERTVEAALNDLPGVSARASYASGTVRVEFDRAKCPIGEIVRRLDRLGCRLRPKVVRQPRAAPSPAGQP